MKVVRFFLACLFLGSLSACSDSCRNADFTIGQNQELLSIVSWNTQTFFDGEKNGNEYSDFQKSGNWNREKYCVRLGRLCEVIKALDADVFVLEEIENEGILQDISNNLIGEAWNGKNLFCYSCFAKPEGSSIGIGILSKYELSNLTTHSLDIRTQKNQEPSLRYLIQVTIAVNGKELILFANHWKSMSGSKEETEIWRNWQESSLAARFIELEDVGILPALACGDFNRDIEAFVKDFQNQDKTSNFTGNILLRHAGFGEMESVSVHSPWYSANGALASEIGSYYFQEKWERIDHFFTFGDVEIISFGPAAYSPWASDGKIPFSYKLSTGEGYSDHLPLLCKIRLQ